MFAASRPTATHGEAFMNSTDNFAALVPIMMGTFGVLFAVLSRYKVHSAWAWSGGFLLGALGFLAPLLALPIPVIALAADALFLASFYCYGEALLVHFDRPALRKARIAIALLALAIDCYVVIALQSLHLELLLIDTAIAVLLAISLIAVAHSARRTADRVLIAVATVVLLETLARIAFTALAASSDGGLETYASSDYAYFAQIGASLLSLCFALSVLGALASRLLVDYRDAAERDPLTQVLNRRGFDAAVSAISRGRALRGFVLTCDIDHFKRVNDSFGHGRGDLVIVKLAELLVKTLPADAVIARFGGEEFVAFLPETVPSGAAMLAHSVRMRFAAQDWREVGIDRQITVSFGLSPLNNSLSTIREAMDRADEALYSAKAGGRNQVMIGGDRPPVPAPVLSSVA